MPGELTFAVNKPLVAGGLVVTEDEVKRAVAFAFRELKLVVEPSGAVPLAALLAGRLDVKGQVVGAMVSAATSIRRSSPRWWRERAQKALTISSSGRPSRQS